MLKDSGVSKALRRISINGLTLLVAASMFCATPGAIYAGVTATAQQQTRKTSSSNQTKKQASTSQTKKASGSDRKNTQSSGAKTKNSTTSNPQSQKSKAAQTAKQSSTTSSSKGNGAKGNGSKGNGKSTSKTSANAAKKSAQPQAPRQSAAELKKQQQSAQAEIQKTREEIRKNEQEVKQGLNELSRLEDDIAVSKKETTTLSNEVGKLNGKITTLETNIAKHQQELEKLRAEYLKAVKKMRVSKKRNSKFAYIFSAKDMAQADRRMRYLKEFSEWKDRQTKEIDAKVATLNAENQQLKRAKSDKDVMLGRELKAQQKLTEQKQRQDVIVADLKANGDVLQAHLAKKQSEVNALKNQVAAVIAEEQRRAEERRRAEQQRQAEIERKRQQEAARQERERVEREQAAEAAKKRDAEAQAKRDAQQTDLAKTETPKTAPKKEAPKTSTTKKEPAKPTNKETSKTQPAKSETPKSQPKQESSSSGNKDYASARQRKPRSESKSKETPKEQPKTQSKPKETPKAQPKQEQPKQEQPKSQPKKESGGDFAAAKGSLPRPVGGAWRVTGKFGRHALPDLPDVTYDNPGIDVEVAKGASVSSVFPGTVSGVYMVPGFATVVIVNHGDYYTVYGNVASASVKVGDTVKQGQHLGKVADDADNPGHGMFHFEVWKGREKLNPSNWIR